MSTPREDAHGPDATERTPNLRYWRGGSYERSYAWGRWRLGLALCVVLGLGVAVVVGSNRPHVLARGAERFWGSIPALGSLIALGVVPLAGVLARILAVRHGAPVLLMAAAALVGVYAGLAATLHPSEGLRTSQFVVMFLVVPVLVVGAVITGWLIVALPQAPGPHARFLYDEENRSWIGAPILRTFGPAGFGLGGLLCGNSVLIGCCEWRDEYFQNDNPINLDSLVPAPSDALRVIEVRLHPSRHHHTGLAVQPGERRGLIDDCRVRNDLLLVSLDAVWEPDARGQWRKRESALTPGWVERRFVLDMMARCRVNEALVPLPPDPGPLPPREDDAGDDAEDHAEDDAADAHSGPRADASTEGEPTTPTSSG
jgi:hypothetical protein